MKAKDETKERYKSELEKLRRRISELKASAAKHKKALRESDKRVTDIAENALIWIWEVDANGKYTYASPMIKKILGYKPDEILKKHFYDLFHPEDLEDLKKAAFEIFAQKRHFRGFLNRNVHKNGRTVWLSTSGVPVLDKNGNFLGYRGADIDITERRKVEQDLRDANMRLSDALTEIKHTHQQIIQHERLSALGQMASGIAHDFNNALMPILGFSEILLSSPDILKNREETMGMLKDIHSAAEGATQAVRRLRDFYRPTDEEYIPINVNMIVETAITLTQPKWKEESRADGIIIEIKNELQEIPAVNGKESQLCEMFTNMILNSIDAMPVGGAITIRSGLAGEWITVEIQDTGTGMSEDVRQHCFEPFFSTKGDNGTGMGLALAYGIVRQHGGTIDVKSELGRGSTFIVNLPRYIPVPSKAEAKIAGIVQVAPMHILVIDDDLWSHDIIRRYLTSQKHTVETAETGQDGLEKFRKGRFDLVITDRAMPDMSGDEVAATIKSINSETPIILATGFGEVMKDKGELPPGVDMIVSKPITERDLQYAVAKIVAHNKADNKSKGKA